MGQWKCQWAYKGKCDCWLLVREWMWGNNASLQYTPTYCRKRTRGNNVSLQHTTAYLQWRSQPSLSGGAKWKNHPKFCVSFQTFPIFSLFSQFFPSFTDFSLFFPDFWQIFPCWGQSAPLPSGYATAYRVYLFTDVCYDSSSRSIKYGESDVELVLIGRWRDNRRVTSFSDW